MCFWRKKCEQRHTSQEDKLEKPGLGTRTQLIQGGSWMASLQLPSPEPVLTLSRYRLFAGSVLLFFATILQPTKLRTLWESWGTRKSCYNTVHTLFQKTNKPKSCDLKIIYKPLQDSWAAGSRVGASNLEFVTRAWKKTQVSRGNTSDLPTKAETCHRGCLTIYKRTRRDDGRFQRVMNKVGGSKLCISGSATHVARRS